MIAQFSNDSNARKKFWDRDRVVSTWMRLTGNKSSLVTAISTYPVIHSTSALAFKSRTVITPTANNTPNDTNAMIATVAE